MMPQTLNAFDAIAAARHWDPFSFLGPHVTDGGLVVRAVFPAAEGVSLVRNGSEPLEMTRRHSAGVYEIVVHDLAEIPDYRLRVAWPGGVVEEVDDPYRYGRVISDFDLYLFGEGNHTRIYDRLGAHAMRIGSAEGVHFGIWAPNAARVSVVGDWNGWDGRVHPMRLLGASGVWEIFIPAAGVGQRYKFELRSKHGAVMVKADPFGFGFEIPPRSAAVITRLDYEWHDQAWMRDREAAGSWFDRPMAVYEVHLGSWARVAEEGHRFLTYHELADRLIPYVKEMGYTHIELLPVMEHPFSGSWGYQVTGFYAPTSRFGSPLDFKAFVDACHQQGIGVILDWVPGHFPKDAHALARFDGTALFEHDDPRQGEHRDWGTLIFNYGRNEVRNFLLANALFWLQEYHADGLRVDAVASMLYLDYSRSAGEWVPNRYGGRENLDAVGFLRQLNTLTHGEAPGSITVAEESTAWPMVSRPAWLGGLGFTYKWNMGWMNDILEYVHRDPVHRRWEHRHITFSLLYAFTENFILPFSHDEVVHGKGSMYAKIPGDEWQRAATLRALYGYMYTHPGKKLMFMGMEFGQRREWNYDTTLDWHELDLPLHKGVQRFVRDLNRVYAAEPALYEVDFEGAGFQWIDCNDNENSVVSLVRRGRHGDWVVVVLNFTPVPRHGYHIGVPHAASYTEVINSDAAIYGGGNVGNGGVVFPEPIASHGFEASMTLTLPPLGFLLLRPMRPEL
ncbi:MAG TPA: 1,4-alpha-glucan branching protein GlgB [Vicinamibacterales bacterium]|nr:1,4-alpha-glucan branching protein GlgB [Vicinamibacterales bacterium]